MAINTHSFRTTDYCYFEFYNVFEHASANARHNIDFNRFCVWHLAATKKQQWNKKRNNNITPRPRQRHISCICCVHSTSDSFIHSFAQNLICRAFFFFVFFCSFILIRFVFFLTSSASDCVPLIASTGQRDRRRRRCYEHH